MVYKFRSVDGFPGFLGKFDRAALKAIALFKTFVPLKILYRSQVYFYSFSPPLVVLAIALLLINFEQSRRGVSGFNGRWARLTVNDCLAVKTE